MGYKSLSTAIFLFDRFLDQILKRIGVLVQLLNRIGIDFWVTFDSRVRKNEAKTFEGCPFWAKAVSNERVRKN